MNRKLRFLVPLAIALTVILGWRISLELSRPDRAALSVKELANQTLQTPEDPVREVLCLRELDEVSDIMFERRDGDRIAASVLVKDREGYWRYFLIGEIPLSETNRYYAHTFRVLPGKTLYWGIAESPQWRLDLEGSHTVVLDGLTICYYLNDKTLDEEFLRPEFVPVEPG